MNCPYCNNEVPPGVSNGPSCNGPISGNPVVNNSALVLPIALSSKFAWILALLPDIMWMALILLGVGILPDDVSDETAATVSTVLFWIGVFLSFGLNYHLLEKDGKLLAGEGRCDEMHTFRRVGIVLPLVYLCARAAKIDNNWAYAIVLGQNHVHEQYNTQ